MLAEFILSSVPPTPTALSASSSSSSDLSPPLGIFGLSGLREDPNRNDPIRCSRCTADFSSSSAAAAAAVLAAAMWMWMWVGQKTLVDGRLVDGLLGWGGGWCCVVDCCCVNSCASGGSDCDGIQSWQLAGWRDISFELAFNASGSFSSQATHVDIAPNFAVHTQKEIVLLFLFLFGSKYTHTETDIDI